MAFSNIVAVILAVALAGQRVSAIAFDPCAPIEPIRKGVGQGFTIGLAFWPGGLDADWGPPGTGLQPCNATEAKLLAQRGVRFATFNARVDQLSVLRTGAAEGLDLLSVANRSSAEAAAAAAGKEGQQLPPRVVSVVAFRGRVRSEARYVASLDANVTRGIGVVATLSLMAKFDRGELKYLQFYNLTCNECGGVRSDKCLAWSDCALPADKCPCGVVGGAAVAGAAGAPVAAAAAAAGNATAPDSTPVTAADKPAGEGTSASRRRLQQEQPEQQQQQQQPQQQQQQQQPQQEQPQQEQQEQQQPVDASAAHNVTASGSATAEQPACDAAQMAACATAVTLAYDGVDASGAALATAAQVRKLGSYSLLGLFTEGRGLLAELQARYVAPALAAVKGKVEHLIAGASAAVGAGGAAAGGNATTAHVGAAATGTHGS